MRRRSHISRTALALLALLLQAAAGGSAGACADMDCPTPGQDVLVAPCCCGDDCGRIAVADMSTAPVTPSVEAPLPTVVPAVVPTLPVVTHPAQWLGIDVDPPPQPSRPTFLLHRSFRL